MEKFLQRIINYRKAKGLTQKQMADKLNIAQVNYSKIETGKTELTLSRLVRIANILEVDLITLLWPDINRAKFNQQVKEENSRLVKIVNALFDYIDLMKNSIDIYSQMPEETKKEYSLKDFINLRDQYDIVTDYSGIIKKFEEIFKDFNFHNNSPNTK